MNSSIYRFTLDMHSAQSQVSIPVMLGDTGRTLRINLSDGSNPYVIAGEAWQSFGHVLHGADFAVYLSRFSLILR